MLIQVRQGLFETNSSSTHTLTMCTDSDYEKWKNGELIFDRFEQKLIPVTDEIREAKEEDGGTEFVTYEEFGDWSFCDLESFEDDFTTPGGENVHAFGYFGYDG